LIRELKRQIIRARAWIAWNALRLLFQLPDRKIAAIAGLVRDLALPFVRDPESEGLLRLQELQEIFTEGPPWSEVIRRIILSAREEQALAVFRGGVRHLRAKDRP